jgi:hypothetical protein
VIGAPGMKWWMRDGHVDSQGPHKRELRWIETELMWSEVAQVVGDEKRTGVGGMVSGRQVEGVKVIGEWPLVNPL